MPPVRPLLLSVVTATLVVVAVAVWLGLRSVAGSSVPVTTSERATAPHDTETAGDGPVSPSRPPSTVESTPVVPRTPAPRDPAPRPGVSRTEPLAVDPLPATTSPEGWLVAGGSSVEDIGAASPTIRWTVEIEPATGLDLGDVLGAAESALYDPRSWASDHRLERVDDPAEASIRVLVARPETVDRLCARVDLDTNGIFSCWNGRFAAINLMRWEQGATGIDDLAVYRTYVVNHEVGHGLGYDHEDCPGAGEIADVMQQQTRTLDGCLANPWPFPGG